jgi:hypothetical protein
MRKLLTKDGPEKMTAVIEGSPLAERLLQIFKILREIQGYPKAVFLTEDEMKAFYELVIQYFNIRVSLNNRLPVLYETNILINDFGPKIAIRGLPYIAPN